MSLEIVDLTPRIGSEIKSDMQTLLSGAHATEIRELLEKRGVLVIRDIFMEKEQQLQFAHTLGKVQPQGDGGIFKISIDPKESPGAEYLKGSFYWHIDGATDATPNFAAMLNPRVLSNEGGDTYFANTYAAYEELSDADKKAYESLRVVHSFEAAQRYVNPEPSAFELTYWQANKPRVHPLVWTHTSGRKSLVLGATASYVEDMDPAAGRMLLAKLRDHATQPENVYIHKWRLGDLLIWDNTGTMHRVDPYPVSSGRLLHRTTIDGVEAIA